MEKINKKNCASAGGKWIRPRKRLAIYERDSFTCVYCRRSGIPLEVDHVIPQSLGGENFAYNLVTACVKCNHSRQNKTVAEFVKYLAKTGTPVRGVAGRIRKQTSKGLIGYTERASLMGNGNNPNGK